MTAPFPRDHAFEKVLAWRAVPHMRKILDTAPEKPFAGPPQALAYLARDGALPRNRQQRLLDLD